jgi:hypothetical protein
MALADFFRVAVRRKGGDFAVLSTCPGRRIRSCLPIPGRWGEQSHEALAGAFLADPREAGAAGFELIDQRRILVAAAAGNVVDADRLDRTELPVPGRTSISIVWRASTSRALAWTNPGK